MRTSNKGGVRYEMNGFVKKILFSVFSLSFFFFLFGTVTYAWFSLSKFNQLSNLDIEILTGEEFQISLNGVNYYNEIKSEEIEKVIGTKAALSDVTSLDGENFTFGPLKEDETPLPNEDFISFELYFRTVRPQIYVYLVENISHLVEYDMVRTGTYVVSKGVNWRADCTFVNGPDPERDVIRAGEKHMIYAADAIRVAFVEKKIEENRLDSRDSSELSRKIFDLSGNVERGFGAEFGQFNYYNEKHRKKLTLPEEIPDTVYELSYFETHDIYTPANRNSEILEMMPTEDMDEEGNAIYLGKVLVNIWLEGWDADCFNAIFRDSVRIKLRFRAGNPRFDL